jgi:molybdate transport system substrate-binding protein
MTLKILSGGAAQGLVESLREAFESETGDKIDGTFGAVGAMRERLLKGQPADLMILSRAMIDGLARDGRVDESSVRDVGTVETAIAVRSLDAPPAVGNRNELREALSEATAIHFPDPKLATAGIHFAKVMRELEIWDAVQAKLRPAPNGATAMKALADDRSERPIGCTQATEILSTDGIALIAPLPPGCELATVYTAAITTDAAARDAAQALIERMTDPAANEARRKLGFGS